MRVDDDGPGIPADVLPDIFDAFVSSRLDAKGTGLGLTVAQGIVQQHGGTIHAGNREGRGALGGCATGRERLNFHPHRMSPAISFRAEKRIALNAGSSSR